ncbi:histone deacetylase HDT2-like [Canna indica]|uniref:Histone deacetylase HDT2-like n=1 Tax=Canna indica TaxID=4628 RepID=A0AAQ3K9X5_9LILI|nr:histone deacetylase HDT2-like [Canna indica]
MEFWGVEVKPGQTVKVEPGEDKYVHLSQASLGEMKANAKENVVIYVKVDDKKLVFGTVSADKCAQIQCDLVFEKNFELSHNSKNATIYMCGYKALAMEEDDGFPDCCYDSDESDSESDEDIQLQLPDGKGAAAAKAKPKVEDQKGDKQKVEDVDEDDSEEDEDYDSEEDDSDEDMAEAEDDSEDDDSSDEEDETPIKKAELSNKRKADSASKTPVSEKKSKIVASGEDKKKGGAGKKDDHSGKKNDKSKQQSPKSGGKAHNKSKRNASK